MPFIGSKTSGLKVILISPRSRSDISSEDKRAPLGLACLAAFIRDKYEVEILDLACSPLGDYEVCQYVGAGKFDVAGLTGMTHHMPGLYRLSSLLKERFPDLKIIFGGVHVTFCYQEAFEKGKADFVVRREGEGALRELLDMLAAGGNDFSDIKGLVFKANCQLTVTQDREFLDLESLPLPARDLLPMEKYIKEGPTLFGNPIIEVMFFRGCPYNCIFCAAPSLYKRRVRLRSVDSAINELKQLMRFYCVKNFDIKDDILTVNKKWILDFCARIIKERMDIKWRCLARVDSIDMERLKAMKKAGCIHVSYGIESGNQKILDFAQKNITIPQIRQAIRLTQRAGIPIDALFIVGHPLETMETILESKRLIDELGIFNYVFQGMTPYVGTELASSIAENTGVIVSKDWDDYITMTRPVYIPYGFDAESLYRIKERLNRDNFTLFRALKRIIIVTGLIGAKAWNKKYIVYQMYVSLPLKVRKVIDAVYESGGRTLLHRIRKLKLTIKARIPRP